MCRESHLTPTCGIGVRADPDADNYRTRSGGGASLIVSVGDESARVPRPLAWNGATLELGSWTARDVRRDDDGLAFVAPSRGDWVSLHWDFICDRLTSPAAASGSGPAHPDD